MVQVMDQAFHFFQLVVIDECVDRRIDFRPEPVCVVTSAPHVVERVSGIGTGPMMRCTHIHGIGAMIDGGDGNVGVTGGRQ